MGAAEMVKEFHERFGHPVAAEPDQFLRDEALNVLRIALIKEELDELIDAVEMGEIVNVADALADLEYVIHGAALAWGIPLDACTAEVHRSNMSKLGEDGKPILREDGKVLKGPNYSPPDLSAVLFPRKGYLHAPYAQDPAQSGRP